MGFPMIQVFVIAARQISKPIADAVIRYGKDHPIFRNKVLIPIGKGLVQMSARLRMKRLGLGEPSNIPTVSEAAALDQASDLVQQLVLFTYSLGVFFGYYLYTKFTTPENLKLNEFEEFCDRNEKEIAELRVRVEELERLCKAPFKQSSSEGRKNDTPSTILKESAQEKKHHFARVSSLPIDAASCVVLEGGEEFIVVRSGTSVGIELADVHRNRGVELVFRKEPSVSKLLNRGLLELADDCMMLLIGIATKLLEKLRDEDCSF